jgi:hypothetical protein
MQSRLNLFVSEKILIAGFGEKFRRNETVPEFFGGQKGNFAHLFSI